jgi:two-component system alkaline phosphatase synthesis response regulator PhoP
MLKIFVVEDDEDICEVVQYALNSAGFDVSGFERGEDFFAALDAGAPALVLLDIMLPGDDGLTILKKLRSAPQTQMLPVILLTAKGSEFDKVKGLDSGADDYLAKPFGVMELIARVNAVLRRSGAALGKSEHMEHGGIQIDNSRREVSVDGVTIKLTFKEYELLYYLMLNRGLALDRSKILDAVWGYDFEGESRTLDMHIRSLRQKLGTAGGSIKTIRNVGYTLG